MLCKTPVCLKINIFHFHVLELVTVSIEIKDSKLSNLCLLLEIEETTRFAINKWRSPYKHILNVLTTLQELCLQRNRHKRAFRIQTHLKVILHSLSKGEAISQEMSLRATIFQFDATVGGAARNGHDDITKNRKTKKFIRPSHHPDNMISCLNL